MKVTTLLGVWCAISIGFKICYGGLTDVHGNSKNGKCENEELRLRVIDQDVKIANLKNTLLEQNVKVANLETTIVQQNTKFEKLVNQVLNRTNSQIASACKFQDRQQLEIEHHRHLNESESTLVEKLKALEINHNTTVLREKIETCFEKQSALESLVQKIVNETAELGVQLAITKDVTRDLYRTDCQDVLNEDNFDSGVYSIRVPGRCCVWVYCDMETDGGGWTVLQRRYDGSVDFYRSWTEYKTGFGNVHKEFWLGNDNIHEITKQGRYKLRIQLEDFSGNKNYAEYSNFSIADEKENYRLSIGSYSGTAGHALKYDNKMMFSTKDRDNDGLDNGHCSQDRGGAWWYSSCSLSNLNGLYKKYKTTYNLHNVWKPWPEGVTNMKASTIMIRKT